MKSFLKILLLLGFFSLSAQTVFLPNIGTKWHYLYYRYLGTGAAPSSINSIIEYKRDSIYNGDTVKVLRAHFATRFCAAGPANVLIKQRNDSVWFLGAITFNTWQLLIDYNASPGQKWVFSVYSPLNTGSPNTNTVTVNSVDTVVVNNFPLKTLHVTYKLGTVTGNSIISERFGNIDFLFNAIYYFYVSCDDGYANMSGFLCYQDSTFGTKQFSNYLCDYVYPVGIDEQNINNTQLNLYPNPTTEQVAIRLGDEVNADALCKFGIYNVAGQLLREEGITFKNKRATLKTSDLQNGIYFVKLQCDNKVFISKLVIVR